MTKKSFFHQKQHLIISNIRSRFFNDTCMFYKVSKLSPNFLSTLLDIHENIIRSSNIRGSCHSEGLFATFHVCKAHQFC